MSIGHYRDLSFSSEQKRSRGEDFEWRREGSDSCLDQRVPVAFLRTDWRQEVKLTLLENPKSATPGGARPWKRSAHREPWPGWKRPERHSPDGSEGGREGKKFGIITKRLMEGGGRQGATGR